MIDWYLVATSALWILGASILLAAFSYHKWAAGERGVRLRDQWHERSWQLASAAGMLLFCLGFGLSEGSRWWERVLWLALAVSFAAQLIAALGRRDDSGSNPDPPPAGDQPTLQ
jgi:hypothetical protein